MRRSDLTTYGSIDPNDRTTIVNMIPFGINDVRPGGAPIEVPPCPEDQDYVCFTIGQRITPTDRGDIDGTYVDHVTPSRELAADVIRNAKKRGFFVAAGVTPTEAELEAARAVRLDYAKFMVSEGDELWRRYHRVDKLSGHHHWAARFLRVTTEWSSERRQNVECPECGAGIPPQAARCLKCGAIVDWIKAADRGLLDGAQLERAYAIGKLTRPAPANEGPRAALNIKRLEADPRPPRIVLEEDAVEEPA